MKFKITNLTITVLGLLVAIITMYLTYETLYKDEKNTVTNNNSGYIHIGGDVDKSTIKDNEIESNNEKIRVEKSSISDNKSGYIEIGGSVKQSDISNNKIKNNISDNNSKVAINIPGMTNSKIEGNTGIDINISHTKKKYFLEEVFNMNKWSSIDGNCSYLYSLSNFLYPEKNNDKINSSIRKLEKRKNMTAIIKNINNDNLIDISYCLNEKTFCEKLKIIMKPKGVTSYLVTNVDIISNKECTHISTLDCSNTSEETLAYIDYSSHDSLLNGVPHSSGKTTKLHKAVQRGDLPLVSSLLAKNKSNIDAKNEKNQTALSIAVWNNFPKITKILIENKANIFAGKGSESWSLPNEANDPMTGIKPEIGKLLNKAVLKVKSLSCTEKKITLD